MAKKTVTLSVRPRGKPAKKLPESAETTLEETTEQLYERIAAEAGLSVHRLRITKGSDGSLIPAARDVTIDRTGLRDQSVIYVKDLGPQIAWRTVFLVEYLGPILIHPTVYFLRPYIYNTSQPASTPQTLSMILITLHFVKREYETLFVHRFSSATMPAFNIFKNCAHYWFLAGWNLAFWIYRDNAPTAKPSNVLITTLGILLFIFGEFANLNSHLILRDLRQPDTRERGIPKGFGFGVLTCPNYFFELVAWAGIWLLTWSLSTGVFVVFATVQMAAWARKKETRYRREFRDRYKRKRYTFIPGLL